MLQPEEVLFPPMEAGVSRGRYQREGIRDGRKEDLHNRGVAMAYIGLRCPRVHRVREFLLEMDTCVLRCGLTAPRSIPEGPPVAMDGE